MMRSVFVIGMSLASLAACAAKEEGVIQGQKNDAAISLSEGACSDHPCPVYDMTLHPDGAYILNGQRFVKTTGVSDGKIGEEAWTEAEKLLGEAGFWTLAPDQTPSTLHTCQPDAPTAKVMWRTADGKEKTVSYNAGCGVTEMNQLVANLRHALHFDDLVWTNDRFRPDGSR